jgi:hypothetical protein
VEVGSPSRRVSKASAQFFLDWVRERIGQIKFANPHQQDEVAQPHRRAEQFWLERVQVASPNLANLTLLRLGSSGEGEERLRAQYPESGKAVGKALARPEHFPF